MKIEFKIVTYIDVNTMRCIEIVTTKKTFLINTFKIVIDQKSLYLVAYNKDVDSRDAHILQDYSVDFWFYKCSTL